MRPPPFSFGAACRAATVAALLAAAAPVAAETAVADGPAYSARGADTCLRCHDEDSAYPVLPLFAGPHGALHDPRAPMSGRQCEACHGPGGDHAARISDDSPRPPMPAFGRNSPDHAEAQNGRCLDCHSDHLRAGWDGGGHADAGLLCSDCHQLHTPRDPMRHGALQTERCSGCHLSVRGEMLQRSAHPLRQGGLACADCHQPHGASAGLLREAGDRDSCLGCHAEKRGPFLWEHAPASEDCGLCHRPHGSNHAALLTAPRPLLCQQCHSGAGHPGTAWSAEGLPGGQPSVFLLQGSCNNCHGQVHGSNHPSGAGLMR